MRTVPATSLVQSRLTEADFADDSAIVAQRLLGCTLVRMTEAGERLAGVIVETEAYLGVEDKAAHSYGGRRTARNESMYGRPGTCYVYFTYGMHHCVNVVCGGIDEPIAVLLRAIEPTEGLEAMRRHRSGPRRRSALKDVDLCSGPGKLCQALSIDRTLNGLDFSADERLFIEPRARGAVIPEVVRSPRIGVAYAGDWASRPLRFHVANSQHISRK